MEKKEKMVQLWSELECLFDMFYHLYHDWAEKGKKKWTEVAAALKMHK